MHCCPADFHSPPKEERRRGSLNLAFNKSLYCSWPRPAAPAPLNAAPANPAKKSLTAFAATATAPCCICPTSSPTQERGPGNGAGRGRRGARPPRRRCRCRRCRRRRCRRCRRRSRRPPCSAALLPSPPPSSSASLDAPPLRQIRRALTHLQGGPAAPDEKRRVGGRRSPQQPPFVTGRSNFVCELRCYIDREWCSGACGPSPVSSSCNMGVRASERARTPRLKLVCRCSRTSDCRPPQQQKGAGEQDITPTRLVFIAY